MAVANDDFSDDDVRIDILTENTAQSVLNNLKALMSNQAHARTRWVWELLQNARDAGADVVSVKHDEDKVVFRHDGASFTTKEIGHLIYHGSTKAENPETIGQYGSGFLTTHLLSPEIRVSGRLEGRAKLPVSADTGTRLPRRTRRFDGAGLARFPRLPQPIFSGFGRFRHGIHLPARQRRSGTPSRRWSTELRC